MKAQFWLDKWERQETGFHLPSVHSWLKKYYATVFNQSGGVFVPLCGKSTDLSYFAENNHYTLGCELSLKAAKQFFAVNQLEYEVRSNQSFKSLKADNLEILVGDYFNLQTSQLAQCQFVYDRAALIALPEAMRVQYVQQMRTLIPAARLLLITLEYEQESMSGPPFSVVESEVQTLFSFANIKPLNRREIIEKEPKFRARGLTYMYECAYCIHW